MGTKQKSIKKQRKTNLEQFKTRHIKKTRMIVNRTIHHRHERACSPPPGYGHDGQPLRNYAYNFNGGPSSASGMVAAVLGVVLMIIVVIVLAVSGAFKGCGDIHYDSVSSSVPESTSTTTVTETAHQTGYVSPWAKKRLTEVGPTHVSIGPKVQIYDSNGLPTGRWKEGVHTVKHEREHWHRRLARLGA